MQGTLQETHYGTEQVLILQIVISLIIDNIPEYCSQFGQLLP